MTGRRTAAAINAEAVNNPAPEAVPDNIATEAAAAQVEYDTEHNWLKANANVPDP